MQYELYYSTGGHSGPYHTKLAAKTAALTRFTGSANERWIDIKTRSINSEVVARITRDDYHMVVFELGETKSPTTEKINMAQFEFKTTVVLFGVGDIELENSKVLHPDVIDQLKKNLEIGEIECEITLDEVYELNKTEV